MINVTPETKMLLKNVEQPEGLPEDTVLRLDSVGQLQESGQAEIGLYFGEPRKDDQVVEHEEQELLHIGWVVSEALEGSTLHVAQTPEGRALGIEVPESEPPIPDGS